MYFRNQEVSHVYREKKAHANSQNFESEFLYVLVNILRLLAHDNLQHQQLKDEFYHQFNQISIS